MRWKPMCQKARVQPDMDVKPQIVAEVVEEPL